MLKFPKPTPRVIERASRRKEAAVSDRSAKAAVRERDQRRCRVCSRRTTEVHEGLRFKSLGGVASLENSFCACSPMNGNGLCHPLLQQHVIRVIGENANKRLAFEMDAKTAYAVFGRRPVPSHVRVTGPGV